MHIKFGYQILIIIYLPLWENETTNLQRDKFWTFAYLTRPQFVLTCNSWSLAPGDCFRVLWNWLTFRESLFVRDITFASFSPAYLAASFWAICILEKDYRKWHKKLICISEVLASKISWNRAYIFLMYFIIFQILIFQKNGHNYP